LSAIKNTSSDSANPWPSAIDDQRCLMDDPNSSSFQSIHPSIIDDFSWQISNTSPKFPIRPLNVSGFYCWSSHLEKFKPKPWWMKIVDPIHFPSLKMNHRRQFDQPFKWPKH
jgi:hypothetical protein